jgi:hypothetical protein
MSEKLEIVVSAKDQASAVLKGVAGSLKGEIKSIEGASRGLATTSNHMAGTTVAGFGKMRGSAKGFVAEINASKLAMAGLAAGAAMALGKFIGAAAQAEDASAKLGVAIRNSTQAINQGKLDELSKSLQKVTRYDDEATQGAMAFLVAAKLSQSQVERLTPAILDLAEFMGKDLEGAAKAVAFALEKGTSKGFARLKIVVDETKFALDPVGALLDAISAKAGGMAVAAGKTASGQLDIFRHSVEELEEALGTVLLPTLKMVVPMMTKLADAATALSKIP